MTRSAPSLLLLVVLAWVALVAPGCASAPERSGVEAVAVSADGTLLLERVPCESVECVFRGTLYPLPRHVEYGDRLLPLDDVRHVTVDDPEFPILLAEAGLAPGWDELPYEGFVLWVTRIEDRTVVLRAARTAAGQPWVDAALAQLEVAALGRTWVREARVLDHPGFHLRGNKRPQAWETAYRANFAWGAREEPGFEGRLLVPFVAPGDPLDPSSEGVARVMVQFEPWIARGVLRYAVKFDDVGFTLTPHAQLAYGSYPVAVTVFLARIRQELEARVPEAVLYYLPQTYWWNDERLLPFTGALRRAGGLDRRLGLVMTGPDVVSREIDAEGMRAARAAFGLEHTAALIYDNLGREGDWGPLEGRDADLHFDTDAVFGERGTPVNRLTRLDWLWNPDDYDPEASYERAVYELAGVRAFASLRAACEAFRTATDLAQIDAAVEAFAVIAPSDVTGPLSHAELVGLLRGDLRRLRTFEEGGSAAR